MGRKKDPNTRYRVRVHNDKGHKYASVQEDAVSPRTGKKYPKTVNLGTLDNGMVFTPNEFFRLMSVEERIKYVFPPEWDISKAVELNVPLQDNIEMASLDTTEPQFQKTATLNSDTIFKNNDGYDDGDQLGTNPSNTTLDQYNNRLYGAFWLLEQISEKCGLRDDLIQAFAGNIAKANEVLSLALYPYLSGRNYNRFSKWQKSNKTLLDYPMKPAAITRLTQNITDNDRMTLIGLRLKKIPEGTLLDCDSTTRSAWGKCLADVRWGHNKDNGKLRNTVETVVYSLGTHEPVYYRTFPGNTSDMSTIRTILADLRALDIDDVIFMTDRGYTSSENIAAMVSANLPFLVCAKTGCSPVLDCLLEIRYDENGLPNDMFYDQRLGLYYAQKDIPTFSSKLSDGTSVKISGLKANLFLDLRNRVDELERLKSNIEKERNELDSAINEGFIPPSIKKYNAMYDYFKVKLLRDKNKKIVGIQYTECTEKIKKEKSFCGFFSSLMYDLKLNAQEALQAYKERDEHEKNFDQMKNQMHFRVQRNSTEDGKNGRSFIIFTGLIPISKLRYVWRTTMIDDYDSALDMLDEMESILKEIKAMQEMWGAV